MRETQPTEVSPSTSNGKPTLRIERENTKRFHILRISPRPAGMKRLGRWDPPRKVLHD